MIIKKIDKAYRTTAVILLNTIMLMLFVNLSLFALFKVKDRNRPKGNQMVSLPAERLSRLQQVYPGMSTDEIRKLMTETYSRVYIYTPFTEFRDPPYAGTYINADVNGFRHVKNQGPWPPDRSKHFTVFLFGGSTTFGYGVPDEQTVASYLQEFLSDVALDKEVRVYNFGQSSYYSTQERILFERLITSGYLPDLAIFIDGVNDFHYLDDRPRSADLYQRLVEGRETLTPSLSRFISAVPMVRAARALSGRFAPTSSRSQEATARNILNDQTYNDRPLLTKVIERYTSSKKIIEAAAAAHGIKAVFVWQPTPLYKYDLKYHLFADNYTLGKHAYSKFGYLLMAEYVQHHSLGDNFLWCADMQEHATEPLYVDRAHYSGKMSSMLAERIAGLLKERGLLGVR